MSEPKQKKKPQPSEQHNPVYFFMMLGLMLLPLFLSVLIIQWNRQFMLHSFDTVNWHVFVFSWQAVNYLTWIVCGVLTVVFYFYVIFVKRYWLLIAAAVMQIGIFAVVWFFLPFSVDDLDIFDSVTMDSMEYHLVQTGGIGFGRLYLFSCENQLCNASEIDYVDSAKYWDADLTYDVYTHSLTIFSDSAVGSSNESRNDEHITITLPEH